MRRQIEDKNLLRTEEVRIKKERRNLQVPFHHDLIVEFIPMLFFTCLCIAFWNSFSFPTFMVQLHLVSEQKYGDGKRMQLGSQ
jgi:hypothetical protein